MVLALPRSPVVAARARAKLAEYPEVPRALTGAFSAYILAWYLEAGFRWPALGAIRIEFLLGSFLVVMAAVTIAQRAESNRSRLTKFIVVYFVYLLLHLAVSQYFAVSWDYFVTRIVKFSCMALFVYAFVRSPKTLRWFVAMLLLAFAKVGEEAFLGKITGSMVWENQGIMRLNGTVGSQFGHPSSLSGLAVCSLPFIFCLFPLVKTYWKIALGVLFVFAVNMIVFTGSRTGYVGVVALLAYAWLRSERKVRSMLMLVLVGMMALPLVPEQYHARFQSAFVGKEAEGNSKAERLEIAGDAWHLFLDNPQGLGIYGFRYARVRDLQKSDMDTHNLYLQLLVDLGVIGALIFLSLIVGLLRELFNSERSLQASERTLRQALARTRPDLAGPLQAHLRDVAFTRAIASAFLAYVVSRLALGMFGHDLYEVYWWVAAGASIAIVNMKPALVARTEEILSATPPGEPPTRRAVPSRAARAPRRGAAGLPGGVQAGLAPLS